jgi:hypothetical protein
MISVAANVADEASGTRMATRVGDISITGCYLDSINTFPEGTRLRLHIYRGDKEFRAEGTVRYAKSGMGMGIAFLHLDHEQEGVLQGWIEELAPPGRIEAASMDSQTRLKSQTAAPPESSDSQTHDALVLRLIEMLRDKDLLNHSEVEALLRAADLAGLLFLCHGYMIPIPALLSMS